MAGRKFKDGDVVQLFASTYVRRKQEGIIPFFGTIDTYSDGYYRVRDIVGCFKVWKKDTNEFIEKYYRVSMPGSTVFSLPSSDMANVVNEETLKLYSEALTTDSSKLLGKVLTAGNFNGGELRVFPINTFTLNTNRLLGRGETYIVVNVGSRTVDSVIGNVSRGQIDAVINTWPRERGTYRSQLIFFEPYVFVDSDDLNFVYEWKERHQDYIVGGEVL